MHDETGDIQAEVLVLRARLFVMELFVDMIWTDRFSQTDSPESEAKQFKETVLNLIDHPEEFADQDELLLNDLCREFVEMRLASILRRVRSL